MSGLAGNWVWIHSTGLQWAAFYPFAVISSLPGEMSWLVVHVAQRIGERRRRRRLEAAEEGGDWSRRGEIQQQIQAFSHYHPPLSLSSADSHTASLCCTQLNVHSYKLSLLPDFTPSPSCPANVSSTLYWMHKVTFAILCCISIALNAAHKPTSSYIFQRC